MANYFRVTISEAEVPLQLATSTYEIGVLGTGGNVIGILGTSAFQIGHVVLDTGTRVIGLLGTGANYIGGVTLGTSGFTIGVIGTGNFTLGKVKSLVNDYMEHPFGKGKLSLTGVQYSDEVGVSTATTDITVESVTVDDGGGGGSVKEFEFGLTAAFKATSSTTADIIYQWQARNSGGSWVNLHDAATILNTGTAYIATAEPTFSGRFKATTNLNAMPIDCQLVFQCNEANEGYAKTKNSSYVNVIYAAT